MELDHGSDPGGRHVHIFETGESRVCRRRLAELISPLDPALAKDAADALIDEFGSLSAVLSVREGRLIRATSSKVARSIVAVRRALHHALEGEITLRPLLGSRKAVRQYYEYLLRDKPVEVVRILYLDTMQRLMRDEVLREGDVDSVAVDVRSICVRALEMGAAGVILAHNHPSGDPEPSASDRLLTTRLATALQALDVRLFDHLIIARHGTVSFAEQGLL